MVYFKSNISQSLFKPCLSAFVLNSKKPEYCAILPSENKFLIRYAIIAANSRGL